MFNKTVLWKIFSTMFKVVLSVSIYSLVLFWIFSTQTMSGNQNIGEITLTFLLIFFSFYGILIFLPSHLFLKVSYESSFYLKPLATLYGIELSPVEMLLDKKEKRKIGFYIFSTALLLFVLAVFFLDDAPFMLIFGIIPFYIMIYKNWINGLYRAFGKKFKDHYTKDRLKYMKKSVWMLLLVPVPLFWFFQPWALQILANTYLKSLNTNINT